MNRLRLRGRHRTVTDPTIEDARALALELAGMSPTRALDVMGLGLVLESGERALRDVPLELRHGERGRWIGQTRCAALITDRRILARLTTGQTVSLWWGSLVGFQPCLERGYLVLDYGDGVPRLLSGQAIPAIAIAGVAAIYGLAGLVEHPALAAVRVPS